MESGKLRVFSGLPSQLLERMRFSKASFSAFSSILGYVIQQEPYGIPLPSMGSWPQDAHFRLHPKYFKGIKHHYRTTAKRSKSNSYPTTTSQGKLVNGRVFPSPFGAFGPSGPPYPTAPEARGRLGLLAQFGRRRKTARAARRELFKLSGHLVWGKLQAACGVSPCLQMLANMYTNIVGVLRFFGAVYFLVTHFFG